MTCFVTHRDIILILMYWTLTNLLGFDEMTYGYADVFNVMDQLTDNGYEDIVDSFKKQV